MQNFVTQPRVNICFKASRPSLRGFVLSKPQAKFGGNDERKIELNEEKRVYLNSFSFSLF